MDCENSPRAHVVAAPAVSSSDSASRNARINSRVCPGTFKRAHSYIARSLIVLCCANSVGCCRVLNLAYRTTRYEPSLYCAGCDETRSLDVYSQWAERAWSEQIAGCSDAVPSSDYAFGFRAGFVDYCYAGGTGEPPPVPPRIYWNVELRSPEGKARARDWFEGYRQGARVARAGGYREAAVVASSTGLAVHSERGEYAGQGMSMQGFPVDATAPAEVQPPLEALPVPTTPSPESGSQPPASSDSPPASLPKLTRPKTKNMPDGATVKRRDGHVAATSYTTTTGIRAKTPIAKPAAANDSREQSGQSSPTKMTNCDPLVCQTYHCDGGSENGRPQAMRKNRDETAEGSESCIAAPRKLAEKLAPDGYGDTKSAESNGRGSNVAAPAVIEHTTFVFKQ
jgi:hypothetical protein